MTEEGKTNIQHQYVEVAAELLAKPSALCDLVEAQAGARALVFCNNPSDTDFVEVILKKRGVGACKLIGFVAPDKLEKTQERLKSGELTVLVVTDIAARGLDFGLFSLIVNYSLPSDIETYQARAGSTVPGERMVASIVSPLDIAAFHPFKASGEFEFVKKELPTKADVAKAKLLKIKSTAASRVGTLDPQLVELAEQIAKDGEAQSMIAFLLQLHFETVPQLRAQVDRLSWEQENLDPEERGGNRRDDYQSRGDRGDRGGDRRDRGDRGDRGGDRRDRGDRGDRGGRGGDRDGNRGGGRQRSRRDEYEGSSGGDDEGRGSDRHERDDDGRGHRDDRRGPPPQKIRDDRLYINQGEKQGFDEEQFAKLLKEQCGLERDQLKRFLLRKNYSFADLPEGVGADAAKKLDGVEVGAKALYVAKATQVVTVIEAPEGQEGHEGQDEQSGGGEEAEGFEEEQPTA